MSLQIDKTAARRILFEEAKRAESEEGPRAWEERVERLSLACAGSSKTHIAFLGTAMLAKAVTLKADVFAIKAGANSAGAFSARSLGHSVLVPNASELGVDLGVTGREPLNNQPYFRHDFVDRDMKVHGGARHIVNVLCDVLEELARIKSAEEARAALRAFIRVRRRYGTVYSVYAKEEVSASEGDFVEFVESFVSERSEGGKRAQAVVAGLVDVFAGPERVETGRINDPDRRVPGDVGVRRTLGEGYERVFEVRDKPVERSDLFHFVAKAAEGGVPQAAMVAVSRNQEELPIEEAQGLAAARGIVFRVFSGWPSLVREVFFWCPERGEYVVRRAHRCIYERLKEVEASGEAVDRWLQGGRGADTCE